MRLLPIISIALLSNYTVAMDPPLEGETDSQDQAALIALSAQHPDAHSSADLPAEAQETVIKALADAMLPWNGQITSLDKAERETNQRAQKLQQEKATAARIRKRLESSGVEEQVAFTGALADAQRDDQQTEFERAHQKVALGPKALKASLEFQKDFKAATEQPTATEFETAHKRLTASTRSVEEKRQLRADLTDAFKNLDEDSSETPEELTELQKMFQSRGLLNESTA